MKISDSLDPKQRYTQEAPCPVCGGYPASDNNRCYGMWHHSRKTASCHNVEHVGHEQDALENCWWHSIAAPCDCDEAHVLLNDAESQRRVYASRAPVVQLSRSRGSRLRVEEKDDSVTTFYNYRRADGSLVFRVRRIDYLDGRRKKRIHPEYQRPDGVWKSGLPCKMESHDFVLYNLQGLIEGIALSKRIYVVEGEKNVEALITSGEVATCNASGAMKFQDHHAAHFAGAREVIIWADRDFEGYRHAQDVEHKIRRYCTNVHIVESPLEAEHADVSDHLEANLDVEDVVSYQSPFAAQRVYIGDSLLNGPVLPTFLLDDFLYEGSVHWWAGAYESGKTTLAFLLLICPLLQQRKHVLYLDAENNTDSIAEKLRLGGIDEEHVSLADEYFHYYPFPQGLTLDGAANLVSYVARENIALTCYDTLVRYLAQAKVSENAADEVAAWATAYCESLKAVGCASLVMDHFGKDGKIRGSSDKPGSADVIFELTKNAVFGRKLVGEVEVFVEKDRKAFLNGRKYTYRIGGNEEGNFVFEEATPKETFQVTINRSSAEERTISAHAHALAIYNYIRDHDWCTIKEIIEGSGVYDTKARDIVRDLIGPWIVSNTLAGNKKVYSVCDVTKDYE